MALNPKYSDTMVNAEAVYRECGTASDRDVGRVSERNRRSRRNVIDVVHVADILKPVFESMTSPDILESRRTFKAVALLFSGEDRSITVTEESPLQARV